jgi:hypothetical protein
MIKLIDLLKEVQNQPSPKEQAIIDDILSSLNEATDFSNVMDKVKSYIKKGAINAVILASLMSSSAFSQEQKDQIKDIVKTEKQVDNDVVTIKDFQKLIRNEGFEAIPGSIPAKMISGVENVKVYRAVGQTQAAAMQSAMQQAKNPIKSFKFSREVGNNIEILIAVPVR